MTLPLPGQAGRILAALAILSLTTLALGRAEPPAPSPAPPTVDFDRHIRPILSENCFACHGPDENHRKARLRFDTKDGAFGKLRRGGFAIVPGKAAESALIERITTADPKRLMPPPTSNKHLKPEQLALLRQWIAQGAHWSEHWAFIPPKRPGLPSVRQNDWPRNPIDAFILARMEGKGLHPSPEADRTTLIRRVTLDLTGLPPTPEEVDTFLADTSPNAYEAVVDRLLESPRYGEHMARFWLDAARYGDTHGLHLDNYREMWPYRDWVIRAFNSNLPFDRFVTEQLAGDLLPNATLDQIVASGFNRCHVTTSEGGSIAEECYVRNVVDRVETSGIVFLGLTVGCARCHDHKFDPIRSKDFYQLFAFFNSLDANPLDGNAARPAPIVRVASAEQVATLERLDQRVAGIQKTIAAEAAKVSYDETADAKQTERPERADRVWIDDELPPGAQPSRDGGFNARWQFVSKPEHPVFSGNKSIRCSAPGLSQQYFVNASPGLHVGEGDTLFAYVYLDPANPPRAIMLQWHTRAWSHRAYWGENLIRFGRDKTPERVHTGELPKTGEWVRLEVEADKVGLKAGTEINGWAFTQHGGTVYWDRAGIVTRSPQQRQPGFESLSAWEKAQRSKGLAKLPRDIQKIVQLDSGQRGKAQAKKLRDYFIVHACARTRSTFTPLLQQLAAAEKERDDLDKQAPATLVSKEVSPPRPAYLLKRGEYDQRGEEVGRDIPAFLPPLSPDAPRNRLGLAQWLVAPNHPLTARVAVNRFWQQCFGTGIVKTAEDFGSQGEPPSHPLLLDWLAVQFREDGWDVKNMMKRIVMSATYRQTSRVTKDRLAKDPANRLLSRGPRFRLDAEMLRDQALAASGLLVEKLGGPSVKPPQPRGLWEAVGYSSSNTAKFVSDSGAKVHRRSLYTFWKRTSPPPQMNTFDAPSRESCVVRRERTNTPLQALLLLNEKQFIECARGLAERTLREGGDQLEDRIMFLFRLATARKPDTRELALLVETYRDHRAEYTRDVEAAKKLIAIGETRADEKLDPSELAAWTMVANLILNLDEVINKG